jgi:hypothetical protein
MKNFLFTVFILLLNVPFGYWRYRSKKLSVSWILAIHVPVGIIIGSRFLFDMPYDLVLLPFSVGAFFIGQYLGGRIKK